MLDVKKLNTHLKASHKENRILMERADWLYLMDGYTFWRLGNREFVDLSPAFVPVELDKTFSWPHDDHGRETVSEFTLYRLADKWEEFEALPVVCDLYQTGHIYEAEDWRHTVARRLDGTIRQDGTAEDLRLWAKKNLLAIFGAKNEIRIQAVKHVGDYVLRIQRNYRHFVYGQGDVSEWVTEAYIMPTVGDGLPRDERGVCKHCGERAA